MLEILFHSYVNLQVKSQLFYQENGFIWEQQRILRETSYSKNHVGKSSKQGEKCYFMAKKEKVRRGCFE